MSGPGLFHAVRATGLAGRAGNAVRCCGIEIKPTFRDIFTAVHAAAELFLRYPRQCRRDPVTARISAAGGGLRHGLTLHSIHAAEPSHRLLIEYHGALILGPALIFFFKAGQFVQKLLAILGYLCVSQYGFVTSRTFSFVPKFYLM